MVYALTGNDLAEFVRSSIARRAYTSIEYWIQKMMLIARRAYTSIEY